jgi:hypothetical protein
MKTLDHDKDTQTSLAVHLAVLVTGFCILGAFMYYSATCFLPEGKELDIASFVMIYLREIAMLLFVAVALVVMAVVSAVRAIRGSGKEGKDAGP